MPKKPKKESPYKLRPDVAETAYRVMMESTGQAPKTVPGQGPKNPQAVNQGAKGGKIGGKARAEKLTGAHLSDIGRKGASTRWKDHKHD